MSAPTDTAKTTSDGPGPESPTTARPLELDDDDVQETALLGEQGTQGNSAAATPGAPKTTTEEAAPPKPPRPQTEQQKNEQILKEAFPNIEAGVIKAVLIASGGRIDPAFNALLGMTDPDAAQQDEPQPPPQPPRPTGPRGASATPQSQLEADELYARQLAQHYENVGSYEARTANRSRSPRPYSHQQATGLKPNEMYDRDHSFIDDDLPVIRDNLRKGFLETQTKVTSWFNDLKKKIDGEYDENEDESQPSKNQARISRRSGDNARRSTDYERYDADPQVLGDDFSGMRLNSDGSAAPRGNPSVYRPPPPSTSPRPSDGRKVSFKDGVEDIDIYNASPKVPAKDGSTPPPGKQSKWQPLSTVEPSPIAENDPFSLGDSEDEKESKDKAASKEIKLEDSERLKQAAAEAMADSLVDTPKSGEAAKKS